MSITCVEAGDLLPEIVPCSSQIEALQGSVETNVCQNGVVLVEPSQARRDRLTTIIETQWRTKVIALASVEEWLKLCDYVPAGLVLLSQLDSRADADRMHDIARLQRRRPGAPIFMISNGHAGYPLHMDEPLKLKPIFEDINID